MTTINIHVDKGINEFETELISKGGVTKEKAAVYSQDLRRYVSHNTKLNDDNIFSKIFYRVGQLFLSIFGCSDHQKARNSVKPLFSSLLKESFSIQLKKEPMFQNPLVKDKIKAIFDKVINKLESCLDKISDKMLEMFVRLNDFNLSPKASSKEIDDLKEQIETELKMADTLNGMQNDVKKIIETDMLKLKKEFDQIKHQNFMEIMKNEGMPPKIDYEALKQKKLDEWFGKVKPT